jgi:N-acetyl-gamma-glutamyl-phosphate reductase
MKVVDFSADYRLRDVDSYETWYGGTHPDPKRVGDTPYGLPEWFKSDIQTATLVANPGCYPTSAILALAPLLKAGLISPDGIIVDSKSGISGAGRKAKLATHYPECNESITAYGVGKHRHGPEISQILGVIAGQDVNAIFTPHLVPMNRGILTTAYSVPVGTASESDLMDACREAYRDCPFVRVIDSLPHTRDVIHTNFCDVTVRVVQDRVVTISSEDNLIKGASGAAVQNFNLMFGYPETTALL